MSERKINSEHVNRAVYPYLRLLGDEFSLNLSKEEAQKMGIAEEDYNRVLEELEQTNDRIKEIRKEPNHNLILRDPQSVREAASKIIEPSGRITTTGQEAGHDSFVVPRGTTQVRFSCIGNAAITPEFTCKTEVFGGTNQRTEFGSSFYYTDIDVPLAASGSGVVADLTFKTTDSNGGKCNWQGQM